MSANLLQDYPNTMKLPLFLCLKTNLNIKAANILRGLTTNCTLPVKPVRIVFISDTHSSHEDLGQLPAGDILIHAGDFTESRPPKPPEYKQFIDWYASQPHKHKVLISGNRDQFMDTRTSKKVRKIDISLNISYRTIFSMNVPPGSGWSRCKIM